jgi:3-oxoacyl-[acyl-carrier-protein] synthase-3
MNVGIVSYGLFLPSETESAEALSVKSGLSKEQLADLGIIKKPKPTSQDQPVVMAVKAAKQAMEKAQGIKADNVDLVLWTGEEYKDYIAQTASIRLQEEVGCKKAWAYDLVGQGVTFLLGLRVARDMILGDKTINTVLLAGGTRNVDLVDPKNPHTRFLLPYSASGCAAIIKRDHPENRILEVSVKSHPDLADQICVPGGGTTIPFAPDNRDSDLMFFQTKDPVLVEDYITHDFPDHLAKQVLSLSRGRKISYLGLRHLPPLQRQRVLEKLKLDGGSSMPLYNWGHHGAGDVLISLDLALQGNQLKPKDLVALASGGIGFNYATALIQWGKTD